MKAAVFESFGEPSEVLRVREVPDPKPGPGQVRVRMIAQPDQSVRLAGRPGSVWRPADFAGDAGLRGGRNRRRSRAGPARPLRQGQARRRDQLRRGATGPSSPSSRRGRRGPSRTTSPTSRPPPISSTRPPCWPWSRHVLAVPKGEWLLQSAAGSTLGRMIILLGRHDGFKTLNVVRRREAIDELKSLGGDAVISSADGADRRTSAPHHRRRGRPLRRRPRRR